MQSFNDGVYLFVTLRISPTASSFALTSWVLLRASSLTLTLWAVPLAPRTKRSTTEPEGFAQTEAFLSAPALAKPCFRTARISAQKGPKFQRTRWTKTCRLQCYLTLCPVLLPLAGPQRRASSLIHFVFIISICSRNVRSNFKSFW